MRQDGLASFAPAFADELAMMMEWAFDDMRCDGDAVQDERTWLRDATGGTIYLRISTRPLEQPVHRMEAALRQGIVDGAYRLRPPGPSSRRRGGHFPCQTAAGRRPPPRDHRHGDRRAPRYLKLVRRRGGPSLRRARCRAFQPDRQGFGPLPAIRHRRAHDRRGGRQPVPGPPASVLGPEIEQLQTDVVAMPDRKTMKRK